MKNKIDLRIIKTNKVLFEALITLMEQKDFEKSPKEKESCR